MLISQCCQARIDIDIMICSDCKEHLGDEDIYDDEDEAEEVDEEIEESFASQRISPRYRKVKREKQ